METMRHKRAMYPYRKEQKLFSSKFKSPRRLGGARYSFNEQFKLAESDSKQSGAIHDCLQISASNMSIIFVVQLTNILLIISRYVVWYI